MIIGTEAGIPGRMLSIMSMAIPLPTMSLREPCNISTNSGSLAKDWMAIVLWDRFYLRPMRPAIRIRSI